MVGNQLPLSDQFDICVSSLSYRNWCSRIQGMLMSISNVTMMKAGCLINPDQTYVYGTE